MFAAMPHNTQQGLRKSLASIFSVPEQHSLLPEIQNAIIAATGFDSFNRSSGVDFDTWTKQQDMWMGNSRPLDRFTAIELQMARLFNGVSIELDSKGRFKEKPIKQASIVQFFKDYARLINGESSTLFGVVEPGISKTEALGRLLENDPYASTAFQQADAEAGRPERDDEAVSRSDESPSEEASDQIPKSLSHDGITLEVGLLGKNLASDELREIERKTILEVIADPKKFLDAYDAHPDSKGGREINSDIAKELFYEYQYDPLSRVSAVHKASSLIAELAFQTKLRKLPPNSIVAFMAGGGGSGKGYTLKNTVYKTQKVPPALIYDGTMKDAEGNARPLNDVINSGARPIIYAVLTTAENAATQNVKRSIGSLRLVPKSPLGDGHVGFRDTFARSDEFGGKTIKFAIANQIPVQFFFNDGKSEPREISLEEFTQFVYSENGKVEQLLDEATYAEIAKGQHGGYRYDPRLRDAYDGKRIAAVDASRAKRDRAVTQEVSLQGADTGTGSTDQGRNEGNEQVDPARTERGQRASEPSVASQGQTPAAPTPKPTGSSLIQNALANLRKRQEAAQTDDEGFSDLDDLLGLKSAVVPEEQPFYQSQYEKYKPALTKAFDSITGDTIESRIDAFIGKLNERYPLEALEKLEPYLSRFVDDFVLPNSTNESITKVEADNDPNGRNADTDSETSDAGQSSENVSGADDIRSSGSGAVAASGSSAADVSSNVQSSDERKSDDERSVSGESGQGSGTRKPSQTSSTEPGKRVARVRRDYVAADGSLTRVGSWRDAASNNLDAIELAKKIESEDRVATPEEQKILSKFVGWGASELEFSR